jgi:hypothetical protein
MFLLIVDEEIISKTLEASRLLLPALSALPIVFSLEHMLHPKAVSFIRLDAPPFLPDFYKFDTSLLLRCPRQSLRTSIWP